MEINEQGYGYVDWIHLVYNRSYRRFRELGNTSLAPINTAEFTEQLSNY
jgi:hypothetical protein